MADENKTERVQLLMTPSELKAIDDWSFENRIRGRAEAIRRLCQMGIGLDTESRKLGDYVYSLSPLLYSVFKSVINLIKTRNDDSKESMVENFSKLYDRIGELTAHMEVLMHSAYIPKTSPNEPVFSYTQYKEAVIKWRDKKSNLVDQDAAAFEEEEKGAE